MKFTRTYETLWNKRARTFKSHLYLIASITLISPWSTSAQTPSPTSTAKPNIESSTDLSQKVDLSSKKEAAEPQQSVLNVAQKDKNKKIESMPTPQNFSKDAFAAERDQRKKELEYKHMWIAFGAAWLIIFLFVRKTWARHQSVEHRLDELKERLKHLESK